MSAGHNLTVLHTLDINTCALHSLGRAPCVKTHRASPKLLNACNAVWADLAQKCSQCNLE